MIVGTVKERKNHEYRVGLTPSCVAAFVEHGHKVLVEQGAGEGAGYLDEEYTAAGAEIAGSAADVYGKAGLLVKVKEPLPEEYPLLRSDLILYAYLHLASDEKLTKALLGTGAAYVAYETIAGPNGSLPCLKPMSEIAGRLSVQEGAKYLERPFGGRGVLLGGVPGVEKGVVTLLGGGVVGTNACKMALGLGARVTIIDASIERLNQLDDLFGGAAITLVNSRSNLENCLRESDLVIGSVLIPGAAAPRLIRRKDLSLMKKGSVIVDVAVDQGGCVETTRPTTHDDPTFVVDGVVHYCVANMPGAVPRTSTQALTNATLRYGLAIADHGLAKAAKAIPGLMPGVNIYRGACTYPGVAAAFGLDCRPPEKVLA